MVLPLPATTCAQHKQTHSNMATVGDRQRRKFDVKFKEQVLQYAREHSGVKAAKHFNVDPRQIRYWKKQQNELSGAEKSRARLSGGGRKKVSEDLETELIEWIHDMRQKHNRVSRKMIQIKARELY